MYVILLFLWGIIFYYILLFNVDIMVLPWIFLLCIFLILRYENKLKTKVYQLGGKTELKHMELDRMINTLYKCNLAPEHRMIIIEEINHISEYKSFSEKYKEIKDIYDKYLP